MSSTTGHKHRRLQDPGPLPFPRQAPRRGRGDEQPPAPSAAAENALAAVESMSRKLRDLARELNCLGHFGDDDDRPRAA